MDVSKSAAPLRNGSWPGGPPIGVVSRQRLTRSTSTPGVSPSSSIARSRFAARSPTFEPSPTSAWDMIRDLDAGYKRAEACGGRRKRPDSQNRHIARFIIERAIGKRQVAADRPAAAAGGTRSRRGTRPALAAGLAGSLASRSDRAARRTRQSRDKNLGGASKPRPGPSTVDPTVAAPQAQTLLRQPDVPSLLAERQSHDWACPIHTTHGERQR